MVVEAKQQQHPGFVLSLMLLACVGEANKGSPASPSGGSGGLGVSSSSAWWTSHSRARPSTRALSPPPRASTGRPPRSTTTAGGLAPTELPVPLRKPWLQLGWPAAYAAMPCSLPRSSAMNSPSRDPMIWARTEAPASSGSDAKERRPTASPMPRRIARVRRRWLPRAQHERATDSHGRDQDRELADRPGSVPRFSDDRERHLLDVLAERGHPGARLVRSRREHPPSCCRRASDRQVLRTLRQVASKSASWLERGGRA